MKDTYPCEMSSVATEERIALTKLRTAQRRRVAGTPEWTRSIGGSCTDFSVVSLLSLSLDKTRFYQS